VKLIAFNLVSAEGMLSKHHEVAGIVIGPSAAAIDVDHMTGDEISLRLGSSRHHAPLADLDWSKGGPREAALAWLIADGGPFAGGTLIDADPVEAARRAKLDEVIRARAAAVVQAAQVADDLAARVASAETVEEIEAITPTETGAA